MTNCCYEIVFLGVHQEDPRADIILNMSIIGLVGGQMTWILLEGQLIKKIALSYLRICKQDLLEYIRWLSNNCPTFQYSIFKVSCLNFEMLSF